MSVQRLASRLGYYWQPEVVIVEAIKARSQDRKYIAQLTARANDAENDEATAWLLAEDIRVRSEIMLLVGIIRTSVKAAKSSKDDADRFLENYRKDQTLKAAP